MSPGLLALIIPISLVTLLILIVHTASRPSQPPPDLPMHDSDLDLLVLIASGLSRTEAMQLRATLGEADIWTSMIPRRNGQLDVLIFHDDADEAHALLNN